MTFLSHLGKGACCGTIVGVVSAAYFHGQSELAFNSDSVYGGFNGFLAQSTSVLSLISGPFLGAGLGIGIYGTKKVVTFVKTKVPHPIQKKAFIAVCLLSATAISARAAYDLGKTNNHNRS